MLERYPQQFSVPYTAQFLPLLNPCSTIRMPKLLSLAFTQLYVFLYYTSSALETLCQLLSLHSGMLHNSYTTTEIALKSLCSAHIWVLSVDQKSHNCSASILEKVTFHYWNCSLEQLFHNFSVCSVNLSYPKYWPFPLFHVSWHY